MRQNRRFGGIKTIGLFAAAILVMSVSTSAANAQAIRPFTLAGSVGAVDEDSAAFAQLRNFTVLHQAGTVGSIHIRYNITAVEGISSFCPATQSTVKVRFRNSDDSGATAKVSLEIHTSSVTSGGNAIIYTFSSNARGNSGVFTTATDVVPSLDFDFANNVYWIEATIFRSDAAQFADLGSIQIVEDAGAACP